MHKHKFTIHTDVGEMSNSHTLETDDKELMERFITFCMGSVEPSVEFKTKDEEIKH